MMLTRVVTGSDDLAAAQLPLEEHQLTYVAMLATLIL
jgi:hypothetical protein